MLQILIVSSYISCLLICICVVHTNSTLISKETNWFHRACVLLPVFLNFFNGLIYKDSIKTFQSLLYFKGIPFIFPPRQVTGNGTKWMIQWRTLVTSRWCWTNRPTCFSTWGKRMSRAARDQTSCCLVISLNKPESLFVH